MKRKSKVKNGFPAIQADRSNISDKKQKLNYRNHVGKIIGIDLGTTNSCAAVRSKARTL